MWFGSAEQCLKMCGLEAWGDAIVGSLGVEHRKRTTIGVELAAKVCLCGDVYIWYAYDTLSSHNCFCFLTSLHLASIPRVLGRSWLS